MSKYPYVEAYIPIQQSALVEQFSKELLLLLLTQELLLNAAVVDPRCRDEHNKEMPLLRKLGFL